MVGVKNFDLFAKNDSSGALVKQVYSDLSDFIGFNKAAVIL